VNECIKGVLKKCWTARHGVTVHACNPSAQEDSEFQASLGYIAYERP
jgi:hypothetical protein